MEQQPERSRLTFVPLGVLAAAAIADNPKRHDLGTIERSATRFGFINPPVLTERGRLAAGHGRVEVLAALHARGGTPPRGVRVRDDGEWLIPTIHVDLSDTEARAFLIADNRTVELGGWDDHALAAVLQELEGTGVGLEGVGFSTVELEELLASLDLEPGRPVDPDEVPDLVAPNELYVERGQRWRLGPHVVTCGDATDPIDVDRLLRGQRADMAFLDPPYNVDYRGGAKARRPLENDRLRPDEWSAFCEAWIRELMAHVGGAVYVCMSAKEWPTVARLLEVAGGHWSDTIIWQKDRFTLGRADYQRQFECLWYGWPEGASHHWCGDRDQGDVWQIPRPSASKDHPTQKPVALAERGIANSSPRGASVLDLFLGSGTTLVAADRLGRNCFGMDIEPAYVQLAIERWQRLTGRAAVLEDA